MAISPLDVYRIVADPGVDPETKKQQIDMLYGVAAPINGPDMRTADVDPSSIMAGSGGMGADASNAPPAVPPSATDAGGMSGGMSAAPPPAPAAATVTPAPAMSTIAPADLAAAAASKASTPQAPAPAAPAGPTADDRFNATIGQLTANALRGSPGRRVEAHDQPVSTVVEGAKPIPQEIKDRLEKAQLDEKLGVIVQGDTLVANAEEAKKQASLDVIKARADQTELQLRDQFLRDHLKDLDTKYETMVKDTEVKSGDWFKNRDTGHKILSIIAAGMFGLAGDPDGVRRMIERDTQMLSTARDKKLGAARQSIEDFKGQMLSPEAANAAENALGLRAAAAEARRLAAAAAAPEAKANALAQAQHLETQAALLEAQMAEHEGGAFKTQIAHVPAQVLGGTPGGLAGLRAIKGAGLNPEQALRAATGGSYGNGEMTAEQLAQQKDDISRRVVFPNGETLWAKQPSEAEKLQEGVRAAGEIQNAYRMLRQELGANGHSISPKTLARVQAIVANNILNLKNSGGLGVLSESDLKLIAPLSGIDVNTTAGLDSSTLAGIETAESMLGTKMNIAKKTLYRGAGANAPLGGASASDIEVK